MEQNYVIVTLCILYSRHLALIAVLAGRANRIKVCVHGPCSLDYVVARTCTTKLPTKADPLTLLPMIKETDEKSSGCLYAGG